MDIPQKTSTRLTSTQKKLIETLHNNDVIKLLEQFKDQTFENINLRELKRYDEMHECINQILVSTGIEPHEIFTLLNYYDGNNKNCDLLKKFIVDRNTYIIKYIYGSKSWKKHIDSVTDVFNKKYTNVTNDIIDKIILSIMTDSVNLFDVIGCRITLDSKYNLKKIILNLEDQKSIMTNLIHIGCIKNDQKQK
jgi:hypothetical protein